MMSGHTPWKQVKGALTNLKRDEICPGVTWEQHAESLAMWDLNRSGWTGEDWTRMLPELTAAYVTDLKEDLSVLQPYGETE